MAKIMLVEDDNNLREIYGARLLAEGHQIVAAKDGEEALAIAVKEKPELIISDVMMPRISGFDMLDILRNAPETKFTKVIMMTALSQAEDKARADSLGADRYLVKSQVTLEDVARVVKDVLEGKPETASQGPSLSKPTPEPPTPATPQPTPTIPEPSAEAQIPVDNPKTAPIAAVPETVPTPAAPPTQTTTPLPDPIPTAPPFDPTAATLTDGVATTPQLAVPPTPIDIPPSQILVELPSDTKETATEAPKTAVPQPVSAPEEESAASNVGPNLMEALQQEADTANTDSSNSTVSQTDEIAAEINEQASAAAHGISTQPEPVVEPPIEPEPVEPESSVNPEVPPSTATPPQSTSTDSSDGSTDATRKKVIQPINDLTKGPDLNSLVAAEQRKVTTAYPVANSVITPEPGVEHDALSAQQRVPVPEPPKPPASEHDVISL